MRLTGDSAPGTMNSSSGSGNFLLVPIPECPLLDNKTVKIVVLGASSVGKTGRDGWMDVWMDVWMDGWMDGFICVLKV